MQTFSADRTRSRRWRSGTKRNKRNRNAHAVVCPSPHMCLVHTPTAPVDKLRVMLTPCEQKWVDDVRAGRKHIHAKRKQYQATRYQKMVVIHRRGNPAVRVGMDYAFPNRATLEPGSVSIMFPARQAPSRAEINEAIRDRQANSMQTGLSTYGHRSR